MWNLGEVGEARAETVVHVTQRRTFDENLAPSKIWLFSPKIGALPTTA